MNTEEQQKDLIFKIFSEWQDSTCSDRTQTYFLQLCEQIYKWYKDYHPKDVNNMGLEITSVINSFMNKDSKLNLPKNKDGFFRYLNTSLNNERVGFDREYEKIDPKSEIIKISNNTIKIPREKRRKLRKIEDAIRMKENYKGEILTFEERRQVISKWFKEPEYVNLLNVINIGSILYTNNDENDETDILNFIDTHSVDPLNEYIKKIDTEAVIEAIKSLLDEKQERSRDCYRALFTLHCVENIKDFEYLYPVLDKNILKTCQKDGKNLNQYEIYQKYHPSVQKSSAEAMASTNLCEFLKDIKTYLKEKNI